jgi:hypothetical protein
LIVEIFFLPALPLSGLAVAANMNIAHHDPSPATRFGSFQHQLTDAFPTVPPEVEASYAAIIDTVLAGADLQTISAKRIRKELAVRVGYDITPQKVRPEPASAV